MDVDDGVPVFHFHLEDRVVAQDAGVVDQDVAAPKLSTAVPKIALPPAVVATLS